jgi:hypothetical protein
VVADGAEDDVLAGFQVHGQRGRLAGRDAVGAGQLPAVLLDDEVVRGTAVVDDLELVGARRQGVPVRTRILRG